MREVESAIRSVLQPQLDNGGLQSEENRGHRRSIAAVLGGLEIPETDPIAQLWLTLPSDESLDKKTHRDALFQPRHVDDEFLRFWDRIQVIFDFILGRFEQRYLDYYVVLDELAEKGNPSREDAKRIKQHAPNNLVAYRYFFEKISHPRGSDP